MAAAVVQHQHQQQDEEQAREQRERFLAFVGDDESRDAVDHAVGELMIPNAAVRTGGVRDAIKHLSEQRSPKLLLVDLSASELPLNDINNLADVCEPGVTVIALGERNDVGLFRDLISHGVADYLVKPLTPALVQRAILASGEQTATARHATKLGKLIAVIGARGGVGATTVATSCAWLMANERKRRVALIDLDLQFGTVALALDLEPSHGLREALENPNRIDSLFMDRVMVQHSDKLFVLSAEEAPDEGLLLDYAALELLITELRTKFHFVVVDLPRTPSTCSHYVLQTATELVLVTDLSLAGMRDTMRLAGLMPGTNASCHVSVVANRVGEHKQGEMPRAEFEKGIGRKVEFLLPFDPRTVAAATNFGQPVAAGKGPVARGLRDIAERIGGPAAGTAAVGRSRMWKRLLMKA